MKPRLNPALVAIVGEGSLSRLSFGLISFTLPLYARHLGLSLEEVGVLTALNSAVSIGAKPLMGWAADRFGLKRAYMVAIGLRSLVSLLLGFATTVGALFAIRGIHGLSMSLRDPSANALIAEHGADESVASAFAWYQTARYVAASVSRTVAGVLLTINADSYSLVFFVAFALSLLPGVVVSRYVKGVAPACGNGNGPEVAPQPSEAEAFAKAPAAPSQGRPPILPFALLGFLITGTAEMLNGLFPIIATEYAKLSDAQAGLVYTVSTLAILVSGPMFGWLADRVSQRLMLSIRGVANTLSSILYVAAPNFAGFAVAKTADDMGKAAYRPAWGALMTRISSYDRRSRARTMSWMSMGEDGGRVLAPILAGFLWSAWGITALMGVRVLFALVTEAYAILVERAPGARAATVRLGSGTPMGRTAKSPAAVPNMELQSKSAGGEL